DDASPTAEDGDAAPPEVGVAYGDVAYGGVAYEDDETFVFERARVYGRHAAPRPALRVHHHGRSGHAPAEHCARPVRMHVTSGAAHVARGGPSGRRH
ncbi:MAG TPA: hypothetical protein VHB21_21920, partial [Minicystis sp.]|nr:hypothetical protein [Minicystis sp.]